MDEFKKQILINPRLRDGKLIYEGLFQAVTVEAGKEGDKEFNDMIEEKMASNLVNLIRKIAFKSYLEERPIPENDETGKLKLEFIKVESFK